MTPYNPQRDIISSKGVSADAPQRDLCGREGALQLAAELDEWWHARGYPQVRHWIESRRIPTQGTHNMTWCVRSNLINGVPPPKTGERAPKWVGVRIYREGKP